MFHLLKAGLIVLVLALAVGVSLGQSTVAAMRVHSRAPSDDQVTFADRAFERGMNWSHSHRVWNAQDCPEPDQYFLSGCVAGSAGPG